MYASGRKGVHNFLRSVGLELSAYLILPFGTLSNTGEPRKPVITYSIGTAAARCGVHVLPTLVSVVIITLNLKHVFLGRTLPGSLDQTMNMALLQVAAKMQEMLIDASLAALIVEVIRDDMLYGDGVPLGWVGGGFLFSSLSYFWSADFWCSFRSRTRPWRKRRLYSLLVLTGSIAALAGPACAVLLIPRVQEWPSGGSEFYLHNSTEELWPDVLSFDQNGPEAFCTLPNATYFPGCPSGGYWALRDWMQGHLYTSSKAAQMLDTISKYNCRDVNLFRGSHTLVPDIAMTGVGRNRACETSYHTVHLATAVLQEQIARDWTNAVQKTPYTATQLTTGEYKYWASVKATTPSRFPAVRVACSETQYKLPSETKLVFPVLPEYGCWAASAEIDVLDGNSVLSNESRASWISLPEQFGSISTGLIIELPWIDRKASKVAVGCSIDARWADGLVSQSDVFNDIYTTFGGTNFVGGAQSTLVDSQCTASRNWSAFTPSLNDPWPSIRLDSSWLDVLAPIAPETVPGSNPANLTTLETLISQSILSSAQAANVSIRTPQDVGSGHQFAFNITTYLETVLAIFVADGISRHGSEHLFDTPTTFANWTLTDYNPVPDNFSQIINGGHALQKPTGPSPYTSLTTKITITGFCFKAAQVSDYLSIALLLTHILLALSHTAWLLTTRRSSSCWDSITELIALVQNSRPAPTELRNTCAGIKRPETFARVARIRATGVISDGGDEHATAEHVEVLFEPDDDPASRHHSRDASPPHSDEQRGQDIELAGAGGSSGTQNDSARDPLMPIPRFPTTLTDSAFEEIYHARRIRGRSSVSIAESQSSLLRSDRLHDDTVRSRQSQPTRYFSERVEVDREYGDSSGVAVRR